MTTAAAMQCPEVGIHPLPGCLRRRTAPSLSPCSRNRDCGEITRCWTRIGLVDVGVCDEHRDHMTTLKASEGTHLQITMRGLTEALSVRRPHPLAKVMYTRNQQVAPGAHGV